MNFTDVRLTKKRIRSKILSILNIQKEENRDRKSKVLKDKLLRTKVFKKAKTVMFYISLGGEPDTAAMIAAARTLGKIVMVPVCIKNNILIRPCLLEDSAKLRIGPYGIREPALERPVPLDNLDLVIVPGIAFDKKGNRLGRGKGYYDRFLASLPPKTATIGLAFDFQILPAVPIQAHDVSVEKVLFA